ncbi:MAG: cation-translocating P-type ATPase [Clostridia bacterium]
MNKLFHQSKEAVLQLVESDGRGLSTTEAQHRLAKNGYNQLEETKSKGVLRVFIEQFADLLVIILIVAAFVSMLTDNAESAIVIFAVIIMNAILGTVQHFKAEKSLKSLQALSAPIAKVLRDGQRMEIPSKEVVVGDILVLEAGDLVVADGRVIDNYSLQVNESSLTGESESVNKLDGVIEEVEVALGDQKNMVFSSSMITYGRALVVVTTTGMQTELGRIAQLMNATKEKKTPLQVSLDDFSKKLSFVIMGICALVFGLSIWRAMPILDAMMFAVALAVAAIPEALSSIVTIVLALGTQKMADEHAIMKNLRAVEGLGCVSVICSDKTGTLTQNKMTVQKIFVDGKIIDKNDVDKNKHTQGFLLRSSVLCNDASTSIGDPTEIALVDFFRKQELDEEEMRRELARIGEIPFDSERKLMSTLHEIDGKYYLLTKGAIDVVMERVDQIHQEEGVRALTDSDREKIEAATLELSSEGLRVLGFVYKEIEEIRELDVKDEFDYCFIGLIAMVDPPREESAQAVADCKRAGIKPVMITGDHKITAKSIATKIGIYETGDLAVEGIELDRMSDDELTAQVEKISVYARVSPEHKIRIVDTWQRKGKIVAMTGDGVNDAPALKKADIGIAMGITGTAVSKDAASMILTDDNFATIIKAVTNGRNIYSNIKNSIKFLLSGNMSGIIAVLYTSIMALPVPFTPVHLLFINLLTDSLPAIAIGMEHSTKDLLAEKPRDTSEGILTKEYLQGIISQGIIIAIPTIGAFYLGLQTSPTVASTMAFATLCMARLFHGFNCRGKRSIFQLGLFTNMSSIYAFLAGMILLNTVLFVPALHSMFNIAELTGMQVGIIYLAAFIPTLLIQLKRIIFSSKTN